VRQNRLAVIGELVSDYPTDGIEMNFHDYAPFIARSEVAEHTDTLTEWMRQIRQTCAAAAAEQGRAKRLVARVAATLEGNRLIGHDIETWLKEGLVDTLIVLPIGGDFSSETARLRELVQLAQGVDIPVLVGLDSVGAEQTAEVRASRRRCQCLRCRGAGHPLPPLLSAAPPLPLHASGQRAPALPGLSGYCRPQR